MRKNDANAIIQTAESAHLRCVTKKTAEPDSKPDGWMERQPSGSYNGIGESFEWYSTQWEAHSETCGYIVE